jgi:hypothetical protein
MRPIVAVIFAAAGCLAGAAIAQQGPQQPRQTADQILATIDCSKVVAEQRKACEYKRQVTIQCSGAKDVVQCIQSKM